MATNFTTDALPQRDERVRAHQQAWQRLHSAGAHFSGRQRRQIIEEMRAARRCTLCELRKGALSPYAQPGEHGSVSDLPSVVIDLIHRMSTDPSRVAKRVLDDFHAAGFSDGHYVEVVGVVAVATVIDGYALALGGSLPPLLDALPGAPTAGVSEDVVDDGAFVPIARRERDDMANIVRALGLVPDVRDTFWGVFMLHYRVRPGVGSALTRPQQEFLAARISALNQCFY